MLISVSNKESGEVTVRAECYRSMKISQKPHCLSVRESHSTGSVQVQFRLRNRFLLSNQVSVSHVIAANNG